MKVQTRIEALLPFQAVLEPDDDEDNKCFGFCWSQQTHLCLIQTSCCSHTSVMTLANILCGSDLGQVHELPSFHYVPDMWPIKAEPDAEVQQ